MKHSHFTLCLAAFPFLFGGMALPISSFSPVFANVSKQSNDITIAVNEMIDVPEKTLQGATSSKTVQGMIFFPDGSSYRGKRFTASVPGLYRVVYQASFPEGEIKEEVRYKALAKGSDLFLTTGNITKSFETSPYNPSYQGVSLTLGPSSSFSFNRTFDTKNIDKNTPFIDFAFIPSELGKSDVSECYVRLSDAEDPSTYVEFWLRDGGKVNMSRIYAEAKTNDGFFAGYADEYRGGTMHHDIHVNDGYGAALFSSFCALSGEETNGNSIKLYFDQNENTAYLAPAANGMDGPIPVMNFTDPAVFKSNLWSGFKSNKLRVSVTPFSYSANSCKIIVASCGGYDLGQESMEDKEKPTIAVDFEDYCDSLSSLPKAKVGQRYTVFPAHVNDNFDLDLSVRTRVTYLDKIKGEIDVPITDGSFLVKEEGTYRIHYNATDYHGNAAEEIVLPVVTDSAISSLSFLNLPDDIHQELYTSYRPLKATDVTTSGGSGKVKVTRTILTPKGKIMNTRPDGSLLLDELGSYALIYEGKDAAGSYAKKTVALSVVAPARPKFIEEPSLPKALIKGIEYPLFPLQGVEVVNDQIHMLKAVPTINGKEVSSLVSKNGDAVSLIYGLHGETGDVSSTYELACYDGDEGKNQSAYLPGELTVKENADNLQLTCTASGQEASWITPLNGTDFVARFQKISTAMNYGAIKLKLSDVSNISRTLTIVVDVRNKTFTVPSANGEKTFDLTLVDNEFAIAFDGRRGMMKDTNGNDLGLIPCYDDFSAFSGFPYGVYLTIGFTERTGKSSIRLMRISNQSLGYDLYGAGTTLENAGPDGGKPTIALLDSLESEQSLGARFSYPSFRAFDVLSAIDETNVTIISPSGTRLSLSDGHGPEITEYGTYTIRYTAKDALGNQTTLSRSVFVFDETAPTLEVESLKNDYKVGEKVIIPSYQAKDDSGQYTVDVILIMPDYEARLLVHDVGGKKTIVHSNDFLYGDGFYAGDDAFYAIAKGKYRLRFVCYDASYNRTVVERTFTAK